MNDILASNKYFRANELNSDVVLLTTKLPYLSESNVIFLIDALNLISSCHKKVVMDISEIDDIDSLSISVLIKEITKINSIDGSIKLVVSKDRPIISFSNGDPISEIDLHLSLKSAMKDIIN